MFPHSYLPPHLFVFSIEYRQTSDKTVGQFGAALDDLLKYQPELVEMAMTELVRTLQSAVSGASVASTSSSSSSSSSSTSSNDSNPMQNAPHIGKVTVSFFSYPSFSCSRIRHSAVPFEISQYRCALQIFHQT
jgi:hypothetical protein